MNFLISITFLMFIAASSAQNCPSMPDITLHLSEMREKLDEACNRATNYYIDRVETESREEKFKTGLRERTYDEYKKSKSAYKRAFDTILQFSNASKSDFTEAFHNGGFTAAPLNCYNKIMMNLKVEMEKGKVEYESLIYRLNILFGYYFDQAKRQKYRQKSSEEESSDQLPSSTTKMTSSVATSSNKLAGPTVTTSMKASSTKPTTVKTIPTSSVKPRMAEVETTKTTRVFTTSSKLTTKKPTTTKTTKKTTPKASKSPKTTISKAKSTSRVTTSVRMGSKLPITSESTTFKPSNYTTTTLKCPKLPDIQPYIKEMKEKSTDLCDKAKYYYLDHVDRESNYVVFASKLKERILYSQKAYNASYNITYRAVQNATGISPVDFSVVYTNGGFADWPLSCYNKLIVMLKIEHSKMVGRFSGAMEQLSILFRFYHEQ